MSSIQPLGDRVLVRPILDETVSPGGIALAGSSNSPSRGEAISVGPGRWDERSGAFRAPQIRPGQVVFWAPLSGHTIRHRGEELLVLREDELLAALS